MELSSKIKAMKFMKRKEDAEQRSKDEAKQRELAQQGHWKLSSTQISNPKFRVEYDPSLKSNSNIGFARHSYGQFNPEIERINEDERKKMQKINSSSGEGKSISDMEMASSLGEKRRFE